MEYKIGCSGFYNRHWKGVFYPGNIRQKDWFTYYCQHFTTIELNTTFYKFPTAQRLEQWFNDSPENFVFSVKAPRLISHFKKMKDCEQLMNDFYTACDGGLQHKLGSVLFQFPPLFEYTEERLSLILSNLRPQYKNVVEFRHNSWWNEKVIRVLGESNIIFCSPNHPGMPNELIINSETAYIRWHGNPLLFYSQYTEKDLKKLKKDLQKQPELKEVFVYFNNTASTAGIINAQELQRIVYNP